MSEQARAHGSIAVNVGELSDYSTTFHGDGERVSICLTGRPVHVYLTGRPHEIEEFLDEVRRAVAAAAVELDRFEVP